MIASRHWLFSQPHYQISEPTVPIVLSWITEGRVELSKVSTELNKADIFTKPLTGDDFFRCRALVFVMALQTVLDSDILPIPRFSGRVGI